MKNNYYAIGKIISTLECAYVAGCKALRIANKLKNTTARNKHKGRVMGALSRIRSELKRLAKRNWPLFDTIAYDGAALGLLTRAPVIHSRFVRAVI